MNTNTNTNPNIIHNPLTFNPRVPKLQTQQRKQRNYQHLKPSYQAMNWKNYAINRPRNISLQDTGRMSAKNTVRQHYSPSYYNQQPYEMHNASQHMSAKKVREQNLRLSGITYNSKRQQHAVRVKQDALRRVKMLQQKVLPLISNTNNNMNEQQNEQYSFGWQMKMEQRLLKIQTSIERVRNQVEIKYEKRLLEIQRQWEERVQELMEMVSFNMNVNESNNNMNMNNDMNGQQQQMMQGDDVNQEIQQYQGNTIVSNNINNYNNNNNTKQSSHNHYYRSGFSSHNNNNNQQHYSANSNGNQ